MSDLADETMSTVGPLATDLRRLRRRTSIKWAGHDAPDSPIPAWIAEMDYEVAEPIRDAVTALVSASDLGYPDHHSAELRESVALWMDRDFGWRIDPGDVFVLPDAVRGVEMALLALTEIGDKVVVPTPVYPPLLAAVTDHRRVKVEVPHRWTDRTWALDLDRIEHEMAQGARVVVVCHPQNPLGTILTDAEVAGLARILDRHDGYLISDEIHAPLRYTAERHVPLADSSPLLRSRTITVTSTSKAWNTPGLRCGLLIAPDPILAAAISSLPVKLHKGASILGVAASIAAIRYGGPWLTETMTRLEQNRALVTKTVDTWIPDVRYRRPDATYLAWLCPPSTAAGHRSPGKSLADLVRDRAGVLLNDGAPFGAAGAGWMRLNFATTTPVLTEILRRLGPVLADLS